MCIEHKKKVTQCLPNSPRKQTVIITALATDIGHTNLKSRKPENNPGIHCIYKVTNFYLMSSWVCPGQKGVANIRRSREKNTKLQTPNLLATLKEAHAMFIGENPSCVISFSKLTDTIIYTIICLKSVDVRRLQVAILARSPREISQTDRILPRYFLSRVRVSVRPRIFLYAKKLPNHSRPDH